ncbi:MAG: alpha/beta fold hydrolase, partial [Chloroflexota bacterium]
MTSETQPKQTPYGLWHSPISPQMIGDSLRLNDIQWDSDGKTLVWSERRDTRTVLVAKRGNDAMRDLTDSSVSPSGRVGYGGGEFTVHDGIIYFVHSGRLHRLAIAGGTPQAITPKFGGVAAPAVSPDGHWVVFVHSYEGQDSLAIVRSDGSQLPQKILQGTDFVMQPTWSPDGTQVACVTWNHPQMPWNGSELQIINLNFPENGAPSAHTSKALAGDTETAIFQPQWSPDGRYLAYVSDRDGWWHIYLYDTASSEHRQLTNGEREHGIPAWVQGMKTYDWSADSKHIIAIHHSKAIYSVSQYDLEGKERPLDALSDYTHIDRLAVSPKDGTVALIASASTIPTRILCYHAQDSVQVIRRTTTEMLSGDVLAPCEAITWDGHDGETVHGLYFAPQNSQYQAPDDTAPPLMVLIHGGPTSQRNATFDMEVQFFTSRGYAVLQVNHRGSTGYGKAYMNKHAGNWGVYDVQDSITGAQYLIDTQRADADKVIIMGGSAGGYTALQALVDKPRFFKAAVVSYGVANQFSLVMDTHKFEERYSEWLLGALPEHADKYRDRSPLFHAQKIEDAVIICQ